MIEWKASKLLLIQSLLLISAKIKVITLSAIMEISSLSIMKKSFLTFFWLWKPNITF